MSNEHIPVLLHDVIDALKPGPGKRFIDATAGFGGHTLELAKRGAEVLAIDRDKETVQKLKAEREKINGSGRLSIVHGSFGDIQKIALENGSNPVDGILFDLGFSSWQIDKSGRGFSYMKDEPIDMRFDIEGSRTTGADILNTYLPEELRAMFAKYGELEQADEITQTILKHRPIWRTSELNKLIAAQHSDAMINRLLARIYQAIRITVNDEMAHIDQGLHDAIDLLKPGGILAVISFHSLEDRLVKRMMKDRRLQAVTKKPIIASEEEQARNSRSRSAKLRIAQKT